MYAVIGASGYLGTYVIKNILENTSENILAVARNVMKTDNHRVSWYTCDVTRQEDILHLNELCNEKSGGGV